MRLAHADDLWLLLIIPLMIGCYIVTELKRRRLTQGIIDPSLWPLLLADRRLLSRRIKQALLLVGLMLLIVALLQPQWGYTLKEVKKRGVDLFVLVDTSQSMMAGDVNPSRLERAKRELIDLLGFLQGDRIGLIPFAGLAYVACPLTTDYEAFRMFLDYLDPGMIPQQGTNMELAIDKALENFHTSPARSKAIILITDGEATIGDGVQIVEKVQAAEAQLYIIGIGSTEGAPIPNPSGSGFKTDESGRVILSRLDEVGLQDLASKTGGQFVRSVSGDLDLETIYIKGIKQSLEATEIASGKRQMPIERYQYPLALAFLMLVMESLIAERARQ